MRVAIFTDNDFDRCNGLTTTLQAVLRHAPPDIKPRIYTFSDLEIDERDYLALRCPRLSVPGRADLRIFLPKLGHLQRRLAQDEIHVVHLTSAGPAGAAARFLARRTGLRLVGSFHTRLGGPKPSVWYPRTQMDSYIRWLYGRCERVLVPSHDSSERLGAAGWDSTRLAVWPRGVDSRVFAPERRSESLRDRWGVSDKRPAVLYAGRLSREKGLSLLDQIGSLLYRRRRAYRFIIAGDGPMSQELRQAIPDAVFMGQLPQNQLAVAIASADVFVFPSDNDAAGSAVLEAQACGVPVIVSAAGAPRENMIDGETGLVCRPGDPAAFAAGIEQLLVDRCRRARMGVDARRFAAVRSWDVSLAALSASYRAAAAPGAPDAHAAGCQPLVSARLRR